MNQTQNEPIDKISNPMPTGSGFQPLDAINPIFETLNNSYASLWKEGNMFLFQTLGYSFFLMNQFAFFMCFMGIYASPSFQFTLMIQSFKVQPSKSSTMGKERVLGLNQKTDTFESKFHHLLAVRLQASPNI